MTKTVILSALGVALAGCGRAPQETHAAAPASPVSAHVVNVTLESVPAAYEATGTVKARTTGTVSARIMAYVREVKEIGRAHV